jgi:hypothetical protein
MLWSGHVRVSITHVSLPSMHYHSYSIVCAHCVRKGINLVCTALPPASYVSSLLARLIFSAYTATPTTGRCTAYASLCEGKRHYSSPYGLRLVLELPGGARALRPLYCKGRGASNKGRASPISPQRLAVARSDTRVSLTCASPPLPAAALCVICRRAGGRVV